jgi:hypothetical protein
MRESGSRVIGRGLWIGSEIIASLPGTLGRPWPGLCPAIRGFALSGYVIFFRYQGDASRS